MTPTDEQKNIIDATGHIVVVARPGSGKTFVLSEKIRELLPLMKSHEGVIAISFTNKASKELKDRSLKGGFNKKESFFGTIHKFYIFEIILSFGKQIFGLSENKIHIIDINENSLSNDELEYIITPPPNNLKNQQAYLTLGCKKKLATFCGLFCKLSI